MVNLEILPLGGAGEIGRNCTAVIQGDDIVVIDCGISFPNEEQHGVDIVIPDFSWLIENKERIRAVILTHAHEDHVGALPYLLTQIKVPVYATEFTHAMVYRKLDEKLDVNSLILKTVNVGDKIPCGKMHAELIHITHSIPDSCAAAIHTDHGWVLFTGDFKFDFSPVDGRLTNLQRLTEIGKEGVVCLLSDSTNIDRPGWGPSESKVTDGFRKAFANAPGRILITTFASNIHRMQQAMDVAAEQGRKIAVAGRRMEQTIEICTKLGYLKPPKGIRVRLDDAESYDPDKLVILTTGSQGEPMSALVQMSRGEYSRLKVNPGDTVIYSARPIPGDEAAIWRTINRLFLLGANVVYDAHPAVHVSGHAYQEELKMMINLTRPFYLAPVHGEPRHQHAYLDMALTMGHPQHRMFQLHDGMKLIMDDTSAWTEEFIAADPILLDSSGKNEVDSKALQDKTSLAEFGVVMIEATVNLANGYLESPPKLVTRGFTGTEEHLKRATINIGDQLSKLSKRDLTDRALVESTITDAVKVTLQRAAQLRPVILLSLRTV